MDCAATSIETVLQPYDLQEALRRRLHDHREPGHRDALRRLGYAEGDIDDILAYVQATDENGMIKTARSRVLRILIRTTLRVFDTANVCGSGERYIDPRGHVLMVAALTPLVSGAISKTVNLPREATVQDSRMSSYSLGRRAARASPSIATVRRTRSRSTTRLPTRRSRGTWATFLRSPARVRARCAEAACRRVGTCEASPHRGH